MELILIAFVGTALLMVAELRDFIQRRRTYAVAAESYCARSHSASRVPAHEAVAADNDCFYDAAA